VKYST
jgi:hypothetical protein